MTTVDLYGMVLYINIEHVIVNYSCQRITYQSNSTNYTLLFGWTVKYKCPYK